MTNTDTQYAAHEQLVKNLTEQQSQAPDFAKNAWSLFIGGDSVEQMIKEYQHLKAIADAVIVLEDDTESHQADIDADGFYYDATFKRWWKPSEGDKKDSKTVYSRLHGKPVIYQSQLTKKD